MKKRVSSSASVFLILLVCSPICVLGQTSGTKQTGKPPPAQNEEKILNPSFNQYLTGIKRVFHSKINLIYLGSGVGASLLVWPYDNDITEALEDNFDELELQAPDKFGGFFVITGASLITHLIGRATHTPHIANTGLYLFEAYITTQLFTYSAKKLVKRTRPNGQNNLSFPSGHTSGMFSVASVLDKRYGYKVGIPSYLVASFVGLSRIKAKKHFATDVIAGAALGIIVGRSFVPLKNKSKSFGVTPVFFRDYVGMGMNLRF